MLQPGGESAADGGCQIGLQPHRYFILVTGVYKPFVHGNVQGFYQHGDEFSPGDLLFRTEAGLFSQILPGKNTGVPHPFRRKPAVPAQGVLVLLCVRGFQNGDGYRGFPGNLARRIRGGIDERIHTHLVLFWRVGETAVTLDFHSASFWLADKGIGHGLTFGIGDFQLAAAGQVLIGFHGRVLCHRGFVLLAQNGQGHLTFFSHVIFVDGQITHSHFPVRLGTQRGEGHLRNLLCGENISGLQNPGSQIQGSFGFGQVGDADAGEIFFRGKIRRGKAVAGTAFHFRGGDCRSGKHTQQEQ